MVIIRATATVMVRATTQQQQQVLCVGQAAVNGAVSVRLWQVLGMRFGMCVTVTVTRRSGVKAGMPMRSALHDRSWTV